MLVLGSDSESIQFRVFGKEKRTRYSGQRQQLLQKTRLEKGPDISRE